MTDHFAKMQQKFIVIDKRVKIIKLH